MYVLIDKKKSRGIIIAAALIIIAVAVTACILLFHEGVSENTVFPENVYGVSVHTRLLPVWTPKRPGIPRKIKYIVIHETGNRNNGADASAHSDYLRSVNGETASWHYTVDDKEIYHHIPDNEVAWHAGDGLSRNGGNRNGIGIELCVNSDGDFEKTFINAAKLTAYLLKQYGLTVKEIKQHADFIDKNCPETIRNTGRTEEFISLVSVYLNESPPE